MFRFVVPMVCGLVIASGLSVAAAAAEAQKPEEVNIDLCSGGSVPGFLRLKKREKLDKKIEEWGACELYLRPAILEALAQGMSSDEKCETQGYTWEEGSHDLNQPAGRAAWAIEQLTGLKLTRVTPSSTVEEIAAVRKETGEVVKAYNAGIVAAFAAARHERSLEELKKDYHGKIKAGINPKEWEASWKLMTKLFDEWFPLGKKLSDLEEITGATGEALPPGNWTGFGVNYRFENGYSGMSVLLKVSDGVITSVAFVGID